jgi:aspartyl-tRNA(Asn)/glutamyl-tRNA(Gln) amidotransferase subunit A
MSTTPLTISEAAAAIRSGETTAVELTTTHLARIEAENERLGAFVTVMPETALAAAQAADADLAAGIDRGPLQGIPLAVKDIIATKDAKTTANSLILAPDWGAGIDAPVVARLRAAGAVVIGKSTTSEFACGMPDAEKPFLIPHNPWNLERTPSGSSAGTGIAVAAGLALGGLGTDTGGSVRGPAAANGHTGLKVTFGRVPKNHVVPLGYSLDSIGPMARSARDCALLLAVMAGYDAGDPDAATAPIDDYAGALTGSVAGMRVGVPTPYFYDSEALEPAQRTATLEAIEELRKMGATVVEVEVPLAEEAARASMMAMFGEAFAYHRTDLITRWGDYGRFTRTGLALGALFSAGDFTQAQRLRQVFRRALAAVFQHVDVLITPSGLGEAPRAEDMNLEMFISAPMFTPQWNFSGLPALAAPIGFGPNGLPLSMQIIGKPFAEATVLRVADAYQQVTDWHLRVPETVAA